MNERETLDRLETQRFALFSVLVNHCGEHLTRANVEAISAELVVEVTTGPCAWAFKPLEAKP